MATTTMKQTATLWAWTRRRAARRVPEVVVFSAALAVALLHALDDAFLHREPGVGLGQHAAGRRGRRSSLGLGAIYAFPFLRPAARAALAFFFGALAIVNGTLHVKHIAAHGAATSDLTGALALAAGVVLVGLAAAIPWRHRGEGAASRRRRWAYRIAAVPAGCCSRSSRSCRSAWRSPRRTSSASPIGAPPSADYREVAFDASDGVHLSGWYRPTRNGATILVIHGGGGDRTGAVAHAKLLVRHGYGVLLYDARGRGKSEGTQNAFGWGWTNDIAGRARAS